MPQLKTFIVEDSPVILESLIETLEELADVKVVGSAARESEAVQRISQPAVQIDLLIIDIFLAAGSGLGVLEAANELALKARRVVLTNHATPDIRRRCKELGADRIFDKSGEVEALIDYCSRVAGGLNTQPGELN